VNPCLTTTFEPANYNIDDMTSSVFEMDVFQNIGDDEALDEVSLNLGS
jgi:hypothetical protein